MTKVSHTPSTRSARLDAASRSYSSRPPRQQVSSTAPARESWKPPLTPSEIFVNFVRTGERNVAPDINAEVCPGANIQVLLKMHVEKTYDSTSAAPLAFVLVVRVETPLPTGGTYTARLDSWKKDAARTPLWLASMPYTPTSPLQFHHTLGWLYTIVNAIDARPARCEGDVWSRFSLFIDNVKEAYRVAPAWQASGKPGSSTRPRPRPRPRHAKLDKLVDAFGMLRLTDDDRRDDSGAM